MVRLGSWRGGCRGVAGGGHLVVHESGQGTDGGAAVEIADAQVLQRGVLPQAGDGLSGEQRMSPKIGEKVGFHGDGGGLEDVLPEVGELGFGRGSGRHQKIGGGSLPL